MCKLREIISSLRANYVVIIENDLHYEDDPLRILAKYAGLSEFRRVRLLTVLAGLGLDKSITALENFRESFNALEHTDDRASLLPDELNEYLKTLGRNDVVDDNLKAVVRSLIQNETVIEAFLRNGINRFADERYVPLLEVLSEMDAVEITFYRARPVPAFMEKFAEELKQGIEKTGSVYYLAVIDKMLGEGADESGKRFIEDDLLKLNSDHKLKSLAFLFTTQPNPSQPENFDSYFVREVQKGHADVLDIIAKYLTDISYASVFKSFSDDFAESSVSALSVALRNQHNVRHIISKSINEGISVFDSLRQWFELIIQKKFDQLQVNKIAYYSSLTRFFNFEMLLDHSGLGEHGKELEELNSFELFDRNINRKGLPIFPGDIFEKDGFYYILVGQVCDLLIRDNGTRGGKIAEFLKIGITSFPEEETEKFTVADKSGVKEVKIHHFWDKDKFAVAKIEVSSKNTYFGEFPVLDLCYFNEDGGSEILIAEDDTYSKLHWITSDKLLYLKSLRTYFTQKKDALMAASDITDHSINMFSPTDLFEDAGKFTFGFRRVARLKGRFYDSLYQQVLNYKGRIDLNLIDQAVATSKAVSLTLKYKNSDVQENITTTLTRIKPVKDFIAVNDIEEKVTENFADAVRRYSSFTVGKENEGYLLTLSAENADNYLLELSIMYTDRGAKLKEVQGSAVKYARIFEAKLADYSFTYLDADEVGTLNDEREIFISDLKRGIKFTENNVTIKLKNGSIQTNTE